MKLIYKTGRALVLLLIFWVFVFDFQRLIFSIHYLNRLTDISFWSWIQVFIQSIRLDLAMAAYLSAIPILFIISYLAFQKKFLFSLFKIVVLLEFLLVVLVHSGEINAYSEWNHKLTARVFIHLGNVGEIFKTADYGMTFWFFVYSILEFIFGWRIFRWLFKKKTFRLEGIKVYQKIILYIPILPIILGIYLVFARGGFQQIPINIDAAYYSKKHILNDISVNSLYFFGKSYQLYKRSSIGEYIGDFSEEKRKKLLHAFLNYDRKPDIQLLKVKKPNIVFLVLEGWSATASHLLSGNPGAMPVLDSLAKKGVCFTNIYATGTTSEVGNASIFSGYPALPEIFITMQPYKNRQLKSINQSLQPLGYSSEYYFSGDLTYGNIQSYLRIHDFDKTYDETDFPPNLERGKLNYYDEDLYKMFLHGIDQVEQPFLECAFTGSTHSPFDSPPPKGRKWEKEGEVAPYMNSLLYANECIADFLAKASKKPWYKNTLFILVADHGHPTPSVRYSNKAKFYHIPLLFFGPALKDSVRGMKIDKIGSQADIALTLLHQLGLEEDENYPWSKDLLSKEVPEFALLATIRGFGWVSPKGAFTYRFDYKRYLDNTFESDIALHKATQKCKAFMQLLYQQYKELGSKEAQ